jgi:hypothetical protein
MIVHTVVGTAGRKLLGNGSFVSGHCNCGLFVGCVLLSNAISNAMQFAGCAVLLAVWFCVSKVVFGVGAVILTGLICGLGVGVLAAMGMVCVFAMVSGTHDCALGGNCRP